MSTITCDLVIDVMAFRFIHSVVLFSLVAAGCAKEPPTPEPPTSRSAPQTLSTRDADLCDAFAAHPSDPDKPADVPGIADDRQIDRVRAVTFCQRAFFQEPDNARLRFQHARAQLTNGEIAFARQQFGVAARQGSQIAADYLARLPPPAPRIPPRASQTPRAAQKPALSTAETLAVIAGIGIAIWALSPRKQDRKPAQTAPRQAPVQASPSRTSPWFDQGAGVGDTGDGIVRPMTEDGVPAI